METALEQKTYSQELDHQMAASSVLLLREIHKTEDLYLRRRMFEQACDQECSHISEVLEGSVKTDFRFENHDGKLYLLQPKGVTDWLKMHKHGVVRARARAAEDSRYQPYAQMAEAELEEARMQEELVKNGTPAAMVKLSLCGDDLIPEERLRKIGRDPALKRAYLRVSVFDGQSLHIHSRSLDGMNLADGRDITDGFGLWEEPKIKLPREASSVDILDKTIILDEQEVPVEQMHQLADRLVEAYDQKLLLRTGIVHKAGRIPEGIDTYRFVLDNDDLITAHMSGLDQLAAREDLPLDSLAALADDLRFDIMASFKRRLEGTWIEKEDLGASVAYAGKAEREAGTQFSGCDTVIDGANKAEHAGYVNGFGAEIKTSCVKCPNKKCGQIVDLDKKLLEKGFAHCPKCKMTKNMKTGKLINHQEVLGKPAPENPSETFKSYWQNIGREVQQKQALNKLREKESKRLKDEARLAQSA